MNNGNLIIVLSNKRVIHGSQYILLPFSSQFLNDLNVFAFAEQTNKQTEILICLHT